MACPKQVKTRIATLLFLALLLPCALPAADPESPTARQLLAMVRANQAGQNRDLTGQLKMSSSEEKSVIPFRLLLRGNTITYQFTDRPEALVLHLDENGSRLERVTGNGKAQKITGAKLDELVRGSDISYEDLSLKFLYWTNAIVGKKQESLMHRDCWIVQAVPPRKDESQYDMARMWIEPTGGLLQADCYSKGKLVRRFSVRSVQRAHETGGYILKTMTIQRMDEESKDRYPTELRIQQ
jgi:hypothetical protein